MAGCWLALIKGIVGVVCRYTAIKRLCTIVFALCIAVLLAACADAPELVTSLPHTSSFASNTGPAYQLSAGDKFKLLIFGQESMSGDYTISKDGFIDISEVGKLQAAGLSVDQLEQQLVAKLRHGLVENPQVSILLDAE